MFSREKRSVGTSRPTTRYTTPTISDIDGDDRPTRPKTTLGFSPSAAVKPKATSPKLSENVSSINTKKSPTKFIMNSAKPYYDCWERNGVGMFKMDSDGPPIVREAFLTKGWRDYDESKKDKLWNICWQSLRFNKMDVDNTINGIQLINHITKSFLITKKDALVYQLHKMKKIHGDQLFSFCPSSFILPAEEKKFREYFTEREQNTTAENNLWIVKAAELSRGRGISVISNPSQLNYNCTSVVQQYIHNPLLIHGYKFDLRVYVLVTSFHPLKIYLYQDGLVRFATEKYDLSDLDNICSHLTNASINKHGDEYSTEKDGIGTGSKWTFTQFYQYLDKCTNINFETLWKRIENTVNLTLLSFVYEIPIAGNENTFELFGFDIMFDTNLDPHVLEVNFTPSLLVENSTDRCVKKPLIMDLIDVLSFEMRSKLQEKENLSIQQKMLKKEEVAEKRRPKSVLGSVTHRITTQKEEPNISLNMAKLGQFTQVFPFNKLSYFCTQEMTISYKKKESNPLRQILQHIRGIEAQLVKSKYTN